MSIANYMFPDKILKNVLGPHHCYCMFSLLSTVLKIHHPLLLYKVQVQGLPIIFYFHLCQVFLTLCSSGRCATFTHCIWNFNNDMKLLLHYVNKIILRSFVILVFISKYICLCRKMYISARRRHTSLISKSHVLSIVCNGDNMCILSSVNGSWVTPNLIWKSFGRLLTFPSIDNLVYISIVCSADLKINNKISSIDIFRKILCCYYGYMIYALIAALFI